MAKGACSDWSSAQPTTRRGERVQDHRQIHKLLAQANVGQIGHPKLIDAAQLQARGQIYIHFQVVP